MGNGLLDLPLTEKSVHLCVDMQRLFSDDGPWPTPWMGRVLPVVNELAGRFPCRTIFTRFIPPASAEDMPGMWRRYYKRWPQATRDVLPAGYLELMPSLARLAPPAIAFDKTRYSAFSAPALRRHLAERGADALIITGSETDVCVLSTVLSAVDLGYRVIIVRDGVCSSSDEGHDMLLRLYQRRYSQQVETANAETILRLWN